jgi:hypothetical protein
LLLLLLSPLSLLSLLLALSRPDPIYGHGHGHPLLAAAHYDSAFAPSSSVLLPTLFALSSLSLHW